jgi:hypothetical protein
MNLTRQDFVELVRRANGGDQDATSLLRQMLDGAPELWQQLGDMAAHAEASLLTLVAGADRLTRESVVRKLQSLRVELGGPAPSTLERMAIDRVVIAWLMVQYTDTLMGSTATATAARANQIVKWQDQTARRYNAAVKALLDVRRLLPQASRSGGSPTPGPSNRPALRVVGELESYAKQAPTGT